jgi:hypothetical protein
MQSYGDYGLIPRNYAKSSSTCVDNGLDNGQNEKTGPKVVYKIKKITNCLEISNIVRIFVALTFH